MEALIRELRRLTKATWISSVLFLALTIGFGVSSWVNYRLLADVSALRSETRALQAEVAGSVKESQLRGAQATSQTMLVLEQLKQMGKKLDQLPAAPK
jgi:hypothetical protein